MKPLVPLCLAVVATLAACGDDGASGPADAALAPDATPSQVIMETPSLRPGESVEGIMTAGADDRIVIHLEAALAEIDWNIHGHAGGGTQVVHEQRNQMVVDYVFQPGDEADWYLLVRNSGLAAMDVAIRVELYGDVDWRWQ